MIREYCLSPAPKTVLIVVIPGKVGKGHPLLKVLGLLACRRRGGPGDEVAQGKDLAAWLGRPIRASGKEGQPRKRRKSSVEIVGADLRRLETELGKLSPFAADRAAIDADDVAEVCDWGRTFREWEVVSGLEKADSRQTLLVIGRSQGKTRGLST